ncbi:MAG: hypothetical protein ACTIKD_10635 [Sphingobacteriaceae bacterium]
MHLSENTPGREFMISCISILYKNCFLFNYKKCNLEAIVKKDRKYSVNVFSRILLGLLAVFYVSIFALEALHGHENFIEISSSEDGNNGPDADVCKICAYFAHHDKKEMSISTVPFFAPLVFPADRLDSFEVTKEYQSEVQDFTNRGPPYPFV